MKPPTATVSEIHVHKGRLIRLWCIAWVMLLTGIFSLNVQAQPVVTVRFSNPEFNCANQTYNVDVEFQCNTSGKQLFGMNVRFYYADNVLEFLNFGEFVTGYGAVAPNPPGISTGGPTSGMTLFGFPGPSEYVNGAIQKTGTSSLTLATSPNWTKIFNMNFHVDDTTAFNVSSFCPSLIWDLKEDLSGGFQVGSEGVVITVVNGTISAPSTEHVVQFNWQYDGVPGYPYGYPVQNSCITTICGYAPHSILPTMALSAPGPVSIPAKVTNFSNIKKINLSFDYDTTAMTYTGFTPNTIFNATNGYLNVINTISTGGNRRLTMSYNGLSISLADSASLATFSFNAGAGETALTWVTSTTTWRYKNNNNYPLYDQPFSTYYINGNMTVELVAPLTKVDSTVAVEGDLVSFPVKVWNYLNIEAGSLTLDFDPNVLSYYQAIPNTAIATGFTSEVISSGRLQMSWSGANISLDDGSVLAYIVFSNIGGTSALVWYNDDTTCQYISGITNQPLNDQPTCTFYVNGNVAPAVFIWTGAQSNNWNDTANWEFSLVPDQFTDVIINNTGARSIYPSFTGDFTLGIQCKDLKLEGNAQLSVSGDMNITPGHTLEFTGPGVLHIGGDWINSGSFIPGNGVVDFNGTANASIATGVPPQNYVAAYILEGFTKGMVPISGGMAGPTGSDAHSDVSIGFDFTYLGVTYSQVRINTNGWLSLNLSGTDEFSMDNTILFDTRDPSTALAPWWDNLNADATTSISYITAGTSPSRVFIAEWKHILSYYSGATSRLNFQVKLYEGTNVIEFCYGDVESGTHNGLEGASIGIKDATGGQGHFLEASQNSICLILPCLNSTSNWPVTNFRYTPPVPSTEDTFYKLLVTKTPGNVSLQKNVHITGIE